MREGPRPLTPSPVKPWQEEHPSSKIARPSSTSGDGPSDIDPPPVWSKSDGREAFWDGGRASEPAAKNASTRALAAIVSWLARRMGNLRRGTAPPLVALFAQQGPPGDRGSGEAEGHHREDHHAAGLAVAVEHQADRAGV